MTWNTSPRPSRCACWWMTPSRRRRKATGGMNMTVRYKYVGMVEGEEGQERREFLPGVPARDLTDDDLAALTDTQRADVAASRIYQAASKGKAPTEQEG